MTATAPRPFVKRILEQLAGTILTPAEADTLRQMVDSRDRMPGNAEERFQRYAERLARDLVRAEREHRHQRPARNQDSAA